MKIAPAPCQTNQDQRQMKMSSLTESLKLDLEGSVMEPIVIGGLVRLVNER